MYTNMELWAEIRRRVLGGELSKRAAFKEYALQWDTLKKILEHVEPPGYRQSWAIAKATETIAIRMIPRSSPSTGAGAGG
ncbi:MAG: hypothetical protein AB8B50_21125 [Pirellulaceae bacterium]